MIVGRISDRVTIFVIYLLQHQVEPSGLNPTLVTMHFLLPTLLFSAALATPITPPTPRAAKPVYWLLAGDSTTAPKGGWGDAFLATTVAPGSSGHNYGHSGATTKSFRAGGDWGSVIKDIGTYKERYDVYATIQVSVLEVAKVVGN